MVDNLKKALRDLGFSQYYSDILIFLASQEKPQTAKEVSEGSGVPLARIYSILIDLENRGLIKSTPGKTKFYSTCPKREMLSVIKKEKKKQIEKTRLKIKQALKIMEKSIKQKPEEEVKIRYFTKDKDYWKAYEEARNKLTPADRYSIINSIRLCPSFLFEELDQNPAFKKLLVNLEKDEDLKGLKQHYVVDVEALVQRTWNDLKDREKFIESIRKMLSYLGKYKQNYRYTLIKGMRNILIVIMKDSVFFEFYGKSSISISSAIQIQSKKVAKDFQLWFDSLVRGEHDPEKDYQKFREEVLKWMMFLMVLS